MDGQESKKWPSTSLRLQPGGISSGLAQARHSHGTRGTSLTVAAVKPWRGSRACAAWDPAVNTIPWEIGPCASPGGGIPPRCGGLRVQGTASSPCSTTTPNMVCPPPNPVNPPTAHSDTNPSSLTLAQPSLRAQRGNPVSGETVRQTKYLATWNRRNPTPPTATPRR